VKSRKNPSVGRQLLAVDLWEISLVTFPLLPDARVSAVKTLPPPPVFSPTFDERLERARKIFISNR
jgi:phage head maturation protease